MSQEPSGLLSFQPMHSAWGDMEGSLSFLPSQSTQASSTSSTPSRCWAEGCKPYIGVWISSPPIILYATFGNFSQNWNSETYVNILFQLFFTISNISASSYWLFLWCPEQIQSVFTQCISTHLLLLGHYLFSYVSPSCHCQISRTN